MQTIDLVAHLFIPRNSNNHRSKILHASSLTMLVLFLVVFQFALRFTSHSGFRILGYAANISPVRVIELTNQKRAEAGLQPLIQNTTLDKAARAKGEDMLNRDYWSHVAPDGTEPWKFFVDYGYRYRYAGENLARDFSSPEAAVDAWMASVSHKENVLSGKYSEIGVAVVEGDLAGVDTTLVIQLFGSQLGTTTAAAVPVAEAKSEINKTENEPALSLAVIPTETPIETKEVVAAIPTNVVVQKEPLPQGKNNYFYVSPFDATRGVSFVVIGTMLSTLVVDGVMIHKKKIPRFVGRTVAHVIFLGTIFMILLILQNGKII